MASDYHFEFDPAAVNNTGASTFRLVAEGGQRVLDLGSGPGIVSGALSTRAGKTVTCVDIDAESLAAAADNGVARTVHADLDEPGWSKALAGEQFDVVILADVLEHLRDPGAVLDEIGQAGLLADDGYLTVSIPNAAHEAIITSLVAGEFTYTRIGLLDRTHIRFFTRSSFQGLCEEHGWTVSRVVRITRTLEQTEQARLVPQVDDALRRALADSSADYRTYQYVFKVVPLSEPGRIQGLHDEVDRLRQDRVEEVKTLRRDHVEEVETLRRDHVEEVERLREELAAASYDGDTSRHRIAQLQRERDEARARERDERAQLEKVYRSETWRVGRTVLWLPRKAMHANRRRRRTRGSRQQTAGRASSRGRGTSASDIALEEDHRRREEYRKAVSRSHFTGHRPSVAMGVSTTDLDEGRGDLYTALGLGCNLERLGYEVIYLPPERWNDLPADTDVFLSLLAERTAALDPADLPSSCLRVAWIRNLTDRWVENPGLELYDGILCSSLASTQSVRRAYRGPLGLLPLAVDERLFAARIDDQPAPGRRSVVSTVNSWGSERELHTALCSVRKDVPLALFGHHRSTPAALSPWFREPVSYFALPSVYRQATLLLDDLQGVNRAHGHINSRIFESLACGALPITNAPSGLHEFGLADLPVYRDAAELDRLIHDLHTDEQRRTELVAHLQQVVLDNHTYRRRAETFDRFIAEEVRPQARTRRDSPVIAFAPDYRATNPFQDMLYTRAGSWGVRIIPADEPLRLVDCGLVDPRRLVFHLHWTATILGPATSERDAERRRQRYVDDIDTLLAQGGAFVWTIHNVMPHECRYPRIQRGLATDLAARADIIHVLCERTADLVAPFYHLPPNKVRVVPHSNYVDVYPNIVTAERARTELGLDPRGTVLLFLGGIRPYKGIEQLLDAFETVRGDRSDLTLVVAGQPGRFRGVETLRRRCEQQPGVVPFFSTVPAEEVQLYMNAADVVVLPHRQVLNSGGLFLAWSFGRPVIAPKAGCLQDQVDASVGLTFGPEPDALLRCLQRLDELTTDETRRTAYERAAAYPWTQMSEDYFAMLARELLQTASSLNA